MLRLIVLLVGVIASSIASKISYLDHKVFRISADYNNASKICDDLEDKVGFMILHHIHHEEHEVIDIMISPDNQTDFENLMADYGSTYELVTPNIQRLIDATRSKGFRSKFFDWTRYHTLAEIFGWMNKLAKDNPGKVEIIVAGHSHEGRKLKGVKLKFGKGWKPGIFIEGGIHAREWIAPATVTYLIDKLLNSRDRAVRRLAEAHEWYIFPVVNPDGYVYSHTTDRMWRKNRRSGYSSKTRCYGVDLNRNWDYQWMVGASNRPCSQGYAGPVPFSEREVRDLSRYIKSIAPNLFAYITMHSYGQKLLIPYGHTMERLDNYDEMISMANKTAEALASVHGTQYQTGSIREVLYAAGGTSLDWIKYNLKFPVAIIYEFRDLGKYGFLLPPEQIIPNGEEVLVSLIALFKEAKRFGYPKKRQQQGRNNARKGKRTTSSSSTRFFDGDKSYGVMTLVTVLGLFQYWKHVFC